MASSSVIANPSKKRKTGHSQSVSADDVQALEKVLTDAVELDTSLNPLADLLQLCSSLTEPALVLKAIYALYRVFVLVVRKGYLSSEPGQGNERKTVRSWLWEKCNRFADLLCTLANDEEKALRKPSLQILFSLLKHLSTSTSEQQTTSQSPNPYCVTFFQKIVKGLLTCPKSKRQDLTSSKTSISQHTPTDVVELFVDTWLNVYADVRWYFLREAAAHLSNGALVAAEPQIVINTLSILDKFTGMQSESSDFKYWWSEDLGSEKAGASRSLPANNEEEALQEDTDDWRAYFDDESATAPKGKAGEKSGRVYTMSIYQQLRSPAAHRAVFTSCWLALLRHLSIPKQDMYMDENQTEELNSTTKALKVLHHGVMPHLTRHILIMDWVVDCVNVGGNIGLLALNTLFIFMREHNLDYPLFYTRLYAFLDRHVLHSKYRARFFRLLDLCMGSTHLPAALLASFVKRLSRLSLSAPPAAVIMMIPFTYNVLKRHPALMVMIHRNSDEDSSEEPFKASEPNPNHTDAIDSSLWELVSHKNHYDNAVATLSKVFEEAFTKPNYAMEDFLDHTYATMFATEVARKIKKDPIVMDVLKIRASVLDDDASVATLTSSEQDVIACLWTF